MMKFSDLMNEEIGFDLKDLIKILTTEGYNQYKNKILNRMHEYSNNDIIISMGTSNKSKSIDIFKVRTADKKDETTFKPTDLKHFTLLVRNRTIKDLKGKE